MNRLRRIATWLWRAWPFIIIAIVIAAHWALVCAVSIAPAAVHKWTSVLAQVTGGAIVIYSLSQNLGLFGRGGLWAVFTGWLRDFPWSPRGSRIVAATGSSQTHGLKGAMSQSFGPMTTEQRLDAVEQQLKSMAEDVAKRERALALRIDQLTADTSERFGEAQTAIASLAAKVKESVVGGLMWQVFGVLLATYGILLATYTQPLGTKC